MAETTFDKYFFRGTGAGGGNHYGPIFSPSTNTDLLPTLSADGIALDGDLSNHYRQLFLVKILDDTDVNEIELSASSSYSILRTTKRSGIVFSMLNVGFQNRYQVGVTYWDENIANGQSTFDYNASGKTHMINQVISGPSAGYVSYRDTPADATYTIRNYDNTEDVLLPTDIRITQDIFDTYLDGKVAAENTESDSTPQEWFTVATPPGLSLAHRRRLWVLGYNVSNK